MTPVKKQLKQVEAQFNQSHLDPASIAISDYSSTFTAKLTLPDQMDFDGTPDVSLLNDNGKYKIISSQVTGRTITVTMTVNKNVTSFADLKDAVNGMDDQLKVLVNGTVFNSQAKADTNYTVRGIMNGQLKAKATNPLSGKTIRFSFNWEAEQLPSGADAINPTSKDISFTLKYKAAPAPKPNKPAEPSKPVKPADPAKPNKPVVPVKDSKIAPKTGDQTQLPIYASILLGALVIGTVAFARKRKTDR